MNPLQRHALAQSRKLGEHLTMPSGSRKNISTLALVELVRASNGSSEPTNGQPTMLATPPSLSVLQADVAICVGGGNDPLAEYEVARKLCIDSGKSFVNIVCNDMIACFPHEIHAACTLHPDKWQYWRTLRERSGYPMPHTLWSHRPYTNFTHHTKDWQGSSGLFMVKAARESGHTHIILVGVPMNTEGGHFARNQVWNAAVGFRKGWARVQGALRPFVRSTSGWTLDHFGAPTAEWLNTVVPDPYPMKGQHDHSGVTA